MAEISIAAPLTGAGSTSPSNNSFGTVPENYNKNIVRNYLTTKNTNKRLNTNLIANGENFIKQYQDKLNLSKKEASNLINLGKFYVDGGKPLSNAFLTASQRDDVKVLEKIKIGDVSLGSLVTEYQSYYNRNDRYTNSKSAINSVLSDVKNNSTKLKERVIQKKVTSLHITQAINDVSEAKKASPSFLNAMNGSAKRFLLSTKSGWAISRKTFLNPMKKFKMLKNTIKAKSALANTANTVDFVGDVYKALTQDGLKSADRFASIAKSLTTAKKGVVGTGYVKLATKISLIAQNMEAIKSIDNIIADGGFKDGAIYQMNIAKKTLESENITHVLNAVGLITADKGAVSQGVSIATDLAAFSSDSYVLTASTRADNNLAYMKNVNAKMDRVLEKTGKVNNFFMAKLGEDVLAKNGLEQKLGWQAPEKTLRYSEKSSKAPFLAGKKEKAPAKIKSHTLTNPNNAVSLADKKRNAERKRLIGELSQMILAEQKADRKAQEAFESNRSNAINSKNSEIKRLNKEKTAKQRELNQLNDAAGRTKTSTQTFSTSSSPKVWVAGNADERAKLKKIVDILGRIKSYSDDSHHSYRSLTFETKKKLRKVAEMLGVKSSKYVYEHISTYYDSRSSDLNNMPVKTGYFKPVSTPSTYTQQVTRLVGLTNAERKAQNQLILDINSIDASLTNAYASLNTLNNQGYTTSTSLLADQQKLGKLVTTYLSATKTQIGITQGAQANYTYYTGLISFINNGAIIGGDFEGTTTKTPPSIGMSMRNVNNMDGVFNGNFTIASKVSSDSSGAYSYLSWGLWSASNAATFAQNNSVVTSLVSGGEWSMGKVALDIPKQGSATYIGQLSGDYNATVAAVPGGPGAMSGSINFNANFATGALTGSLKIKHNNILWANSSLTNGQVVFDPGNGGSAHIQAGLSGGSAGGITGGFFGKNGVTPAESGGLWWLRKANNTSAAGLYRAKKQ